jgi:hypothetical protein
MRRGLPPSRPISLLIRISRAPRPQSSRLPTTGRPSITPSTRCRPARPPIKRWGLQWGWLSLLQQDPLNAPAEATGTGYQRIIILFTDSLNTRDRWCGDFGSQGTQVDTRMKTLWDIVKATGVTIYTVQIDTRRPVGGAALLRQWNIELRHADPTEPDRDGVFPDRHADCEALSRSDLLGRRRKVELTQKPGHLAGPFRRRTSNPHIRRSAWGCERNDRWA